MPVKRVRCDCHEPIARDPKATQTWSDVWISFKARPGRRVYRYAPTLISRSDLLFDRDVAHEAARRHPELDWAEELAYYDEVLAALEREPIHIVTQGEAYEQHVPYIYTASDQIDRAEAERMLGALLKHLGFEAVKFNWKRPDLIIIPT